MLLQRTLVPSCFRARLKALTLQHSLLFFIYATKDCRCHRARLLSVPLQFSFLSMCLPHIAVRCRTQRKKKRKKKRMFEKVNTWTQQPPHAGAGGASKSHKRHKNRTTQPGIRQKKKNEEKKKTKGSDSNHRKNKTNKQHIHIDKSETHARCQFMRLSHTCARNRKKKESRKGRATIRKGEKRGVQ